MSILALASAGCCVRLPFVTLGVLCCEPRQCACSQEIKGVVVPSDPHVADVEVDNLLLDVNPRIEKEE